MREFDTNAYTGLRYLAGGRDAAGVDCWGLLRLIYDQEYGVTLPGFAEADPERLADAALAEYVAAHREGWQRIKVPEVGDAVLLRLAGEPMHIGVVCGDGRFIHARVDNDVVVDSYRHSRWAHRVEGFYRYTPQCAMVPVVGLPHPLRLQRIEGEAAAGCTLASAIFGHCRQAQVAEALVQYGTAFINGRPVVFAAWPETVLAVGDVVEFRIYPGKSAGLRIILTVVLAVVSFWAGGVLGEMYAASSFATAAISSQVVAGVAGSLISMAGTALINAIAPIRPAQLNNDAAASGGSARPQYLLSGGANQAMPYGAIPVVLGHHDFTGPLAAKSYITSNGVDRFLHLLIVWGYGPLDVSNLRIGNKPLAEHEDVQVATSMGEAWEYAGGVFSWGSATGQQILSTYGYDTEQQSPQVDLDTAPVSRVTTESNIGSLMLLLNFPQGLIQTNGTTGAQSAVTVQVICEYRRLGYYSGNTWVPVSEDWKDNFTNVPASVAYAAGSVGDEYGDGACRSLVVVNAGQIVVRQAFGSFDQPPAWPNAVLGDLVLYRIENGVVVETLSSGLWTGFTVSSWSVAATTYSLIYDSFTGVTTQIEVPITKYYFSVGSGTVVMSNTYSNLSHDPFDQVICLNLWAEPGQYEVRLRRVSVPSTDQLVSDKVTWLTMTGSTTAAYPVAPPAPVAMTAIRIRATNQLNGSLEGVTATLASRQLVWKSAAWSPPGPSDRRNNPASLFLYVLRHPANAQPVANSAIDWLALQHWAEFCDSKGFIYENVLTGQRPLREVLADIAAAGRASIAMPDGKWSVVIDEPKSSIVQHFTPHNSWGFEGTRVLPKLPHALRINFVNRFKDYQPDEMLVYNDGYSAANATLIESIDLPGVTDPGSAAAPGPIFKLGRFHLEQLKLRPETYTLYTDLENLVCTRGDRVKVAHDVPLWGLGSGRVSGVVGAVTGIVVDEPMQMQTGTSYTVRWRTAGNVTNTATVTGVTGMHTTLNFTTTITVNPPAVGDLFLFGTLNEESVDCLVKSVEPLGDLQARLTMVDYAPAVFDAETLPFGDWESQITEPPPLLRLVLAQKPLITATVTDEKALLRSGTNVQANILLRFSTVLGTLASGATSALQKNIAMVEVQYRLDSTTAINVPYKSLPLVQLKTGSIYIPATSKLTYDVRLRFVGEDGRTGPWTELANIYVSGKSNPPGAVTGITGAAAGSKMHLTWDAHPDLDVIAYEVRLENANWGVANGLRVFYGAATGCYWTPTNTGDRTFYVRARDDSGNWSATATYVWAYPVPTTPGAITATFTDTATTNATVLLNWPDVVTTGYTLKDYLVSDGLTTRYVMASQITWPANWVGDQTFTVKARDLYGKVSAASTKVVTLALPTLTGAVTAKPLVGALQVDWPNATKGSLSVGGYEVRRTDADWGNAGFVFRGVASACTIPGSELDVGANDFFIKPFDTEGHYSAAALVLNYTVAAPNAPASGDVQLDTMSLTNATVTVNWSDVAPPFGLAYYEVSGGALPAGPLPVQVKASMLTAPMNWTGLRTFTVKTVDQLGHASAPLDLPYTVVAPEEPATYLLTPGLGSLRLDWFGGMGGTLPIWGYEVRRTDSGWGTTGAVFKGVAETCTVTDATALPVGVNTFYIKTIDTGGRYSAGALSASLTITNPSAPASLTASFADTALTTATVTLDWPDVTTPFGLKHYLVNDGVASRTVSASTLTLPANWLGDRTFTVQTVDLLGHTSSVRSKTATLSKPGSISNFKAQVVDNNVLLYWTLPAKTSLPISHVQLKKGTTWAGATDIGSKAGSFTSIIETAGGSYTYWAAVVDTENHEGTPVSVTATVNQPPDYVFNGAKTSTLSGTKSSAAVSDGAVVLPVDMVETFEAHFTSLRVTGLTLVAGGTGYAVDDIFRLSTGTYTWQVRGKVTAVSAGVVTGISLVYGGNYTVAPTAGTGTVAITGVGTGLTVTATTASWAGPSAQDTAGFPIYIQPGVYTGYYEETFNFDQIFPATKATASIETEVLSGIPTLSVQISLSANGSSWTDYPGVTEIFGTNFQYVKVRLTVGGDGVALMAIKALTVRLDAKLKSDAGTVSAVSTDASGTVANFSTRFVDVTSVTLTPASTTLQTAVYDFKDSLISGTYVLASNVVTVTATAHGQVVGQAVQLNFSSGTAPPGVYTIASVPGANSFTVALTSANTSGNVSVYSQGIRVYLFNSAGARASGPVSWSIRGY